MEGLEIDIKLPHHPPLPLLPAPIAVFTFLPTSPPSLATAIKATEQAVVVSPIASIFFQIPVCQLPRGCFVLSGLWPDNLIALGGTNIWELSLSALRL